MTVLTDKQQSFVWAVGITGMSTQRAREATVVGIDLDRHRAMQEGFVGKHAVQLSKRPLGIGSIRLSLFRTRLFAMLTSGSVPNVCQLLQSNQTVWVPGHDALGDDMIGVLLQPSLSPADDDQSSSRGASAFLLQTLSQARIMVGFGNNLLPRMEGTISLGRRGDCQITDAYIHANDASMGFWRGVCYLNLKGNQQIKLLLGLVIPELSGSDMSTMLDQGNVLGIRRVGKDHPSIQGQDADPLLGLEGVVMPKLIGQGGGNILGRLIQSLVPLLGNACFPLCGILLDLGPECLVGGSHLTRNATGHLSRDMVACAYLGIGAILQAHFVTHLAVRKRVATHIVQGIAVSQLRHAQCLELFGRRMQSELGSQSHFHTSTIASFHQTVKHDILMKIMNRQGSHPTLSAQIREE